MLLSQKIATRRVSTEASIDKMDLAARLIAVIAVTLKEHVLVFPDGSLAVYVTLVVPILKQSSGLKSLVKVAEQLSFAVGGVQVVLAQVSPDLTEMKMFLGHPVILGAVVSLAHWSNFETVTVNEHKEILPLASEAL